MMHIELQEDENGRKRKSIEKFIEMAIDKDLEEGVYDHVMTDSLQNRMDIFILDMRSLFY